MSASSKASSERLQLAVIDDHPSIRAAIQQAVDDTMDMEVVVESASSGEAIERIEESRPDVAVVDLSLREGHGLDLLGAIQTRSPNTELLVFSMYDEKVYAERALRAGASGYLMKAAPPSEVLTAIRRVADGQVHLSPEMTTRVLQEVIESGAEEAHFPIDELTDRELQVFEMLGQGLTTSEIADQLNLARKTIETYRRRTKEKLGYDTAAEVVSHAARWILGQPEDDVEGSSASHPE